jgi:hypothetical protein
MFNWFAPAPQHPFTKILNELSEINLKLNILLTRLPIEVPPPSATPFQPSKELINPEFKNELDEKIKAFRDRKGMGPLGQSIYL